MDILTYLVFYFTLILLCFQYTTSSKDIGEKCENSIDGEGVCVPINDCETIKSAVKQDNKVMSPATLRLLLDAHCGFSNKLPLVCCAVIKKEEGIESVLTAEPGQWLTEEGLDAPDGTIVTSEHPKIALLPLDICGTSSFNRIGRTTPNELIVTDEVPTVARLIYLSNTGEESFRCTGSLISSRYVLTSARCVTGLAGGFSLLGVVLGDFDITKERDCEGPINSDLGAWSACRPIARRYFIENITIHPSFRLKPRNRRPDIALIRLAHPVNFTASEIIPTCLPLGNFQFINLESEEGKNNLITMGWGSDLRGKIESNKIRMGFLHSTERQKCEPLVGNIALDSVRSVCVEGKTSNDDKISDMGGPLNIIESLNSFSGPRLVQVGILSAKVKDQTYASFTRIGPYLSWILKTIQA